MKTVQQTTVFVFSRLFIVLTIGLVSGVANAQEVIDFPVQGLVVTDDTPIYSGPGSMHYATENLSAGEAIEVWRFDPGGWCAIRPVSSSFCLVPGSTIERMGKKRGRVIDGGVQVWVGTRLGAVEQPLWQVSLVKDEEVEILGEATWPNPEGAPTVWLQIEPPAGEFRWIHRDAIRLPEGIGLPSSSKNKRIAIDESKKPESMFADSNVRPASTFPVQQGETNSQPAADNFLDDPFAGMKPVEIIRPEPRSSINNFSSKNQSSDFAGASQIDGEMSGVNSTADRRDRASLADDTLGWRPARQPIRMVSASSPEPASTPARVGSWDRDPPSGVSQSGVSQSLFNEPVSSGFDSSIAATSSGMPTFGNEPLSSRLASIDVRLGAEIVKPAEYWNLDSIARDVIETQSKASGQLERDQASRMIRKIDDLRKTRANLMASSSGATSPSAIASTRQPVGSGRDTSVEIETSFDATGWLNELVQNNGATEPTFVLQDDNGNITYHIAPSPGLNLNRYLRNRIGVIGQRGYDQRLELNHITADRVTVLEKSPRERTAFRGW